MGNWLTSGAIFSTATYRVYKKLARAYEAKLGELVEASKDHRIHWKLFFQRQRTGYAKTNQGIAITPKKHVKDEQLEIGQQEQKAADN